MYIYKLCIPNAMDEYAVVYMYVCMYVCICHARQREKRLNMLISNYIYMYVCMYVSTYVCMYIMPDGRRNGAPFIADINMYVYVYTLVT